ncbi:MAG: hypothetical protein KQA41_01675 [Candidatus Aenigmarchaeota archaeon]|nr:hypothetical protein [Candidatus Aenigmarchaeota archaeon]
MAKKDASTKQRVLAIVFILILVGSSVAYGIIALFGPKNDFSIPKERILNYKLNKIQVDLLVNNYFTVIEYNYTSSCIECIQIKNYLEDLTQNSDGQIYLQEILVNDKNSIHIINLLNETLIEEPNISQAINAVCDNLLSTPLWCAINRV